MTRYRSLLLVAGMCLIAMCATVREPAKVAAPFEKRVFTLPDGKHMNCRMRPGDGPVLVLIPGTWGTFDRFTELIAALPDDLPVAVIELCWQGGQSPPSTALSIEQLADDVMWVVEALGLEQFYIGGHSIGGMIAVEIAGREVPGLVGIVAMEGWTHHTVVQTAFDGVVSGPLTPAEQAAADADRERERAHLSQAERKAIGSIWTRWNGYESLMRSRVPVLHIWGDRGKPRPDRTALQIPDQPNIEVAWIAGADHRMLTQAPDVVAACIRDFLERTAPPARAAVAHRRRWPCFGGRDTRCVDATS